MVYSIVFTFIHYCQIRGFRLEQVCTLCSPAKVNYTLDILSRREDGYHNLSSIVQVISLSDRIILYRRERPGISLECDDARIPSGSSNLAVRAAEAVLQASGCREGVHIRLEKRIPAQAGLGGGSSNAATVIRGMNRLFKLNLDTDQMATMAAKIGSDCALFIVGGTVAMRGRGEVVTPLNDGPTLWFVIVKPEVNISTAQAYAALDAIPDRVTARSTRSLQDILALGDIERLTARFTNDFERVVFQEHLSIALLHDEFLMARARNARLCGSGSAVFGVCYSKEEAEEVARIMRLKYREVIVCRSLSREETLNGWEGCTSD
jgi:4-diphosphocytidyl-2-C-methyl-D-erythritol kinase